MSLILEALKKSEAERRLGQAPGLMTPMPQRSRRKSRWPLGVAAALLLGVVWIVTWWWLRPPAAPDKVAEPTPAAAASSAPGTARAGDRSGPDVAPPVPAPGAVTAPPSAPAPRPTRPATAAAPALPAELPGDPRFDSVERESMAQPAVNDTSHRITPEASPVATPPTPIPEAAAPAPAPMAPDVPRLDQLDPDTRSALPPLKLSMHVYAEQAPDRFVLIDGRRYGEGEKLAPSLQLIEVRRDGVVLDFNGRRFLLPRP